MEDAKVGGPGADGFAGLVGEDAGELMEMGEVVDGPGGKELGEGDWAEGGMDSAASEISGLKVHGAKVVEILRAEIGEFIEKLREGFALAVALLSEAVEGLEGLGVAKLENHSGAGHPVGAFTVNEMANDVEGAPGCFAFVAQGPGVGKAAKKSIESGGSAGKKRDGIG